MFSIDEMQYANTILITNAKTQARKGLILYNSVNGIITLKNHVYVDRCMITKMFEKVNSLFKDVEKHLQKKTSCKWNNYKKDDVQQKHFLEDLSLLIVKNHLLMHLVQSQWLKKFNLHLCQKFVLPSRK
jgi:hypothetical protein